MEKCPCQEIIIKKKFGYVNDIRAKLVLHSSVLTIWLQEKWYKIYLHERATKSSLLVSLKSCGLLSNGRPNSAYSINSRQPIQ